jgi:hypothetical protein
MPAARANWSIVRKTIALCEKEAKRHLRRQVEGQGISLSLAVVWEEV